MKYTIDRKTSERMTIMKGLFIVLVVLIHSYKTEVSFVEGSVMLQAPEWLRLLKYVISQVIARCAVPGFFLLSAVLLYRKEFTWRENMAKKVQTILVPYLICNSFWILFFYFAQKTSVGAEYFVTAQSHVANWNFVGWVEAYLGLIYDPYPILYPLWFLRDLFLLNLFAKVIKQAADRFPRLILALAVALWVLPLNHVDLPYINTGGVSIQSVVFFVLGYYVVKYGVRITMLDRYPLWMYSILYVCCIAYDVLLANTSAGHIFTHLTIVVGIIWFARLSGEICQSGRKKYWLTFAGYSFFIFLFHEMTLTILMKLIARRAAQTWWVQLLEYMGLPIAVIVLCILGSILMQKVMPGLYKVLTGNRDR